MQQETPEKLAHGRGRGHLSFSRPPAISEDTLNRRGHKELWPLKRLLPPPDGLEALMPAGGLCCAGDTGHSRSDTPDAGLLSILIDHRENLDVLRPQTVEFRLGLGHFGHVRLAIHALARADLLAETYTLLSFHLRSAQHDLVRLEAVDDG
ncbi:hypothetical protein EVAR_66147_1 [Eumeta japonica]|uniref:Uncharacterized protein n=1 Tax=Eumeta variegata TaxID=151549 RepID=A0A4C1YWC4_EUMVA|nr:hypothetical protein EVAR_66147_1 [Eumeta japonica]